MTFVYDIGDVIGVGAILLILAFMGISALITWLRGVKR